MLNSSRRSPQRAQRDAFENDERPLPIGWVRRTSNNVDPGRVYYANGGQTQWNFPNQERFSAGFSPNSRSGQSYRLAYHENDAGRPRLKSYLEMKALYRVFAVENNTRQGRIFRGAENPNDPNELHDGGKYDSLRDEKGKLIAWEYW